MSRVGIAAIVLLAVVGLLATTAASAPVHVTVAIFKQGTGSGRVTADPPLLDCGSLCVAAIPAVDEPDADPLILTAIPDPGSVFVRWAGGGCEGEIPECTTRPTDSVSIFAVFDRAPEGAGALHVVRTGEGTVRSTPPAIDCGRTCFATFLRGTRVTLTPLPARNWEFAGWGRPCSGRRACVLGVDGSVVVTARFRARRDVTAPRVRALASEGNRGGRARLRYRVSDDGGRSRERVVVMRGRRALAVITSPLDAAQPGRVLYYFVLWSVPRTLERGTLRFCVYAVDAAGNRSRPSCAPLRIR